MHTAETILDLIAPDTGAEAVARFISTRPDPGSYHALADSDSRVPVVRYECEAFGDATGSNPHAYHLSFGLSATDWPRLSRAKRAAFIDNGARSAAAWARWVKATRGIVVPARRISRVESELHVPGFISHGERDPGRRHDPGPEFPWTEFLERFADLMDYNAPDPGDTAMPIAYLWLTDTRKASDTVDPVEGVHLYAVANGLGVHQTTGSWKVAQALGAKAVNTKASPFGLEWIEGLHLFDGPLAGVKAGPR